MKKSIKFLSLLILSVIILSSFAGLSGCSLNGSDNKDEILIGVLAPFSGSNTYFGNDMYQSYELAIDEINAAGGILGKQLKLYKGDDAGDPSVATTAAAKIISQGVDFVVGGYASGATIPTLQQFYDAKLIMLISCANSTQITSLGLNQTFMVNSPGTHAVVTLTSLCKSLGVSKIALIHQGDSYSKDLSDLCEAELPKSGFEIATVQVMEEGAADVSAIVTTIKNSGADFVYWCAYPPDGSNVIKQLRRGDYTGVIAVGDGSASVELIEGCGSDGEGVYVTSPPFVEFAEGGEKFVDDYKAKFDMDPGTYATLCYDTIYMLKQAIEKAGTLKMEKVRDAIQDIEYKGLSGVKKFTPEREPEISNFIILQIKDGKFTLVNP
ncbi:MAG: branched-chain amino acid ABC transporter substrate-binding protein [Oscillospiraceae bacterium]|nr:branched-chain amino acid ABC transporter substrate-binding protein [Oscillospiraceae bacterium]